MLLQEHKNKQKKMATELMLGNKAYVRKCGASKHQPSTSFNNEYWGLFPGKQKVKQNLYKLELSLQAKIHPVFYSNVFK